jgi:hypothetical protein
VAVKKQDWKVYVGKRYLGKVHALDERGAMSLADACFPKHRGKLRVEADG